MRPHCKRHADPEALMNYTMRDGAEALGGTLPVLEPRLLRDRLKALAGPRDAFLHMTLSSPKGLQASQELWLKIVGRAMKGIGIDSETTPWFAIRHTDKVCDHVHTGIALCDFAGRQLEARTSDKVCTAVHRDLCTLLGLPEPPYDDGRPTLTPTTPARKIKSGPRRQLHDELTNAFVTHQPESLDALNAVMPSFRGERARNGHGVWSTLWLDGENEIWGGMLGKAWQPGALKLRFDLAASLRRLRTRIENALIERALQHSKLMEILDDFDASPQALADPRASGGAAQQDGEGGSERAGPASSLAPSQQAGGWQGKPRGSSGGPPSRREGSAGAQYGRNDGDRRPLEPDVAATGAGRPGAERENGLTFGSLIARCGALAVSLEPDWKISAKADPPQILLRFSDGSEVYIRPDDLRVTKSGKTAEAFEKNYFPSADSPEVPAEDDDLPTPW